MKTTFELITPTQAKKLLSMNKKNRLIRERKVNLFAYDMANGRWKEETGDPIRISNTNKLLDGQHRLLALIKANVSLRFTIITGLNDEIISVIDTGTVRNAGDVFRINGVKNDRWMGTIIKAYLLLKNGFKNTVLSSADTFITNDDILNEYYEREDFWKTAFRLCRPWYISFGKILSPSIVGGVYSIFHSINELDAINFMTSLCDGTNLKPTDAIYLLRGKLMNDKTTRLKRMPYWIKIALIFKTWNYYRENITPRILVFHPDIDAFPTPK